MAVDAVIFDWGGTLTPWVPIDFASEWQSVAELVTPDRVAKSAEALRAAAEQVWERSRTEHRSATLDEICALAGLDVGPDHLQSYRESMDHITHTQPEARGALRTLRDEGIRVGLLSNTVWPRAWHEEILQRDGILDLFDGSVFTSEIPWTKPHPKAFGAAMRAVGVEDPARCVFVGDRIFDDIYGANQVGMKAVFIPHSDIPDNQHGHSEGTPDAVIHSLSELPGILVDWR